MSDRIPAHNRMSEHLARQPAPDDPAVDAARSAVTVARQRLDHVRRAFTRREAGRTDVATAEHQLSRALDQLDHAAGTGWRA